MNDPPNPQPSAPSDDPGTHLKTIRPAFGDPTYAPATIQFACVAHYQKPPCDGLRDYLVKIKNRAYT